MNPKNISAAGRWKVSLVCGHRDKAPLFPVARYSSKQWRDSKPAFEIRMSHGRISGAGSDFIHR
jgi:hypothetical protein